MKNIVFDFGGVLMQHNRAGCLQAFRRFLSDEDIYRVLGLGNESHDTLRYRFEVGELSQRRFIDSVLEHCAPATTEQQIIDAWNTIHAGIPGDIWTYIRRLRNQGYHTYLMSNTDELHWEHTLALYREPIEELFDEIFLSFRIGCAKPDKQFFLAVDSVLPASTVPTLFVDDTVANRLAAQQSVGWQTCATVSELMQKI
jgi:putative hydrolase of the HAD superfamily